MKPIRTLLAFLLVGSLVVAATAQATPRRHNRTTAAASWNSQALGALQQDLQSAIQAMTAALPIYDGNRVHSIHAAHAALLLTDRAISGANAAVRPKPTVRDHIPSKNAHRKYTQQQIAQSQANMRQGLSALMAAAKDLQAAAGTTPNKMARKLGDHLQKAINEANKAISIHSPQA